MRHDLPAKAGPVLRLQSFAGERQDVDIRHLGRMFDELARISDVAAGGRGHGRKSDEPEQPHRIRAVKVIGQ